MSDCESHKVFEPLLTEIERRYDEMLHMRVMTRLGFAKRAGVSPSTVRRVLNHENVRMSSLIKVSHAVGLHFELVGPE